MSEYKYYIYSPSKHYGAKPYFVERDGLPDKTGFSSLYAVTEDTAEAIESTGTTAQFKGVVHSERLWLDFDTEESSDAAQSKLESMGYDIIVYHSGNRGIHVGILRDHAPSHLLPAKDKAWVEANFPDADRSIYTPLHLFRLPGTRHEKTGRIKEFITHIRGGALRLPALTRQDIKLTPTVNHSGERSVFECIRVMANSTPARNGQRHPQLVRLAYALKDDIQAEPYIALWWMLEVNKMAEEPKSFEEVEQIVKSIYR